MVTELDQVKQAITGYTVMQKGGPWLGAARTYMQWHARRGDSLTWGSNERVEGLSVRDIEQLTADAVAADRKEHAAQQQKMEQALRITRKKLAERDRLIGQLQDCLDYSGDRIRRYGGTTFEIDTLVQKARTQLGE